MPGNTTTDAIPNTTANNHSAVNLAGGNNTLTHHENKTGHVAGIVLTEILSRLRSWFTSWFSKSSQERLLQNIKIQVTQSRLDKLFQSLDSEIPKLKNDPNSIQNMQRDISEFFNNTLPYEHPIASEVMSKVYGFLKSHKLSNEQISQAITLTYLTKDQEQPKKEKNKSKIAAPTPDKSTLLKPKSEASPELLIMMGKEFLQIFTGDSKALRTTTKDIAIEIGNLFHQFRNQDLSEAFVCELSQEASIFIGRTLANNRHRFGSQTRQFYLLEGDSYNERNYFQVSLQFLQALHHTPVDRQQRISSQTLVNILEPLHNNLMTARPGEPIGFDVMNDPSLSTDVELLAEILRHSEVGELGVPITTITSYEGGSYTAEELNYLRAYDIDVPTHAPESVSELVIAYQYRAALRASPPQDLPRLTEHLFQLLLSFSRRDENIRTMASTSSSPSTAELINQQRQREQNVFSSAQNSNSRVENDAQNQSPQARP